MGRSGVHDDQIGRGAGGLGRSCAAGTGSDLGRGGEPSHPSLHLSVVHSGWQKRTEELYALAGEIGRRLGRRN